MDQVKHKAVTYQLITLLQTRPPIHEALEQALQDAAIENLTTLAELYVHVDELVETVPDDSTRLIQFSLDIFLVAAHSEYLMASELFQMWLVHLAQAWGHFLDTPESTGQLEKYLHDDDYQIGDYDKGPSGWMSFNQFFARQAKPGKRPIQCPLDSSVIVAPSDGEFRGWFPIDENSEISGATCKGVHHKISDLLADSAYSDSFAKGVFTHTFLRMQDYHRFHTPVAGQVLEVKKIPGKVELDVVRDGDRIEPNPQPGAGFLFEQDRALMVLETCVGLVALVPIGIALISSVTVTPEPGAILGKGDEFGYFQFGGSDVVTLYQKDRVAFDAVEGKTYLQGSQIAHKI